MGSRCMSDVITSTKLEQTGKIFWDSRGCLSAWVSICVLSPGHESEMRGYLVYVLIVKYLSHRFCLNSATAYYIRRSYRGIFGGFFKTFLEGSVDLIIYRDYIVNRRFFIYCSLAWTVKWMCCECVIQRYKLHHLVWQLSRAERNGCCSELLCAANMWAAHWALFSSVE